MCWFSEFISLVDQCINYSAYEDTDASSSVQPIQVGALTRKIDHDDCMSWWCQFNVVTRIWNCHLDDANIILTIGANIWRFTLPLAYAFIRTDLDSDDWLGRVPLNSEPVPLATVWRDSRPSHEAASLSASASEPRSNWHDASATVRPCPGRWLARCQPE